MAERAAAMLCQLIVRMLPPGASTRARIASNAANNSGAAAFSCALFSFFGVSMPPQCTRHAHAQDYSHAISNISASASKPKALHAIKVEA